MTKEKYNEIYQRLKKENPCIFCVQYDSRCRLPYNDGTYLKNCSSDSLKMYYEKSYSEIYNYIYRIYVLELEQENTELKEAIKHFNPCSEWNDDVHDCEFRHYAMEYGNKLTKAKEVIEKYYKYNPSCEYSYEDINKEAEQFLNDSKQEE